jgi:hypothetical protein
LALDVTNALMAFEVGWMLDEVGAGSKEGIGACDDLECGHVVIDGQHGCCEEGPCVEDPPLSRAEEI